jgi:hypothetical protein
MLKNNFLRKFLIFMTLINSGVLSVACDYEVRSDIILPSELRDLLMIDAPKEEY